MWPSWLRRCALLLALAAACVVTRPHACGAVRPAASTPVVVRPLRGADLAGGDRDSKGDAIGLLAWFESQPSEHTSPVPLRASVGAVPSWLRGSLYRNGPGIFNTPNRNVTHAFDGLAKLYRWHFAGNATTFQARFLRSAAYNASMAPGGSYPNLKTVGPLDPCYTTFEKMTSLFNVNDNAGVNVMQLPDGRIYAVTDNNPSMEFDSATLDTKGKLQYDDKLEDPLVHSLTSAHPVEVPDSSGDMVNYLVNIMDGFIELQRFKLQLYRVNTDLKRRVIAEVTHTHLPYVHSFSVTENYAILAAYPLFMEGATVSDLPPIGAVFPSLKWHGDKANATLYVFSLDDDGQTKPLATYEAPPLFSYHHINAYEDSDGSIVMDLCGYPDAQVLSATGGFGYIGTLQDPEARQKLKVDATIYRYRLPKPSRSGSRERQLGGAVDGFVVPAFVKGIDPAGGVNSIELPRINERLRGRKYCFAYGLSAALNAQNTWDAWRLIKTDMCSIQGGGAHPSDQVAKATVWTEPNQFVTEPIFVERPGASREDDGVLLSHVLDASKPPPLASSYMLILNATDMTVLAKLPNPDGHHEPFSFHGLFDGRF